MASRHGYPVPQCACSVRDGQLTWPLACASLTICSRAAVKVQLKTRRQLTTTSDRPRPPPRRVGAASAAVVSPDDLRHPEPLLFHRCRASRPADGLRAPMASVTPLPDLSEWRPVTVDAHAVCEKPWQQSMAHAKDLCQTESLGHKAIGDRKEARTCLCRRST